MADLTDDEIRAAQHDVLAFWFDELTPKDWFTKNPELDARIRERFGSVHAAATKAELSSWRDTPEGRLAEIIVLDQLSRNIFRDRPEAFASDPLALALAQEAIRGGFDRQLPEERRGFLYMPYMHSESRRVHETALTLFSGEGLEYERKHKAIIDRFGRYPHRNAVLGRPSTPEELAFLSEPGSSF
ncbi:MAG: DUF924 family protein [Sandaracinaceae bacterium]